MEHLLTVYAIERQDQQHSATMSWTLVGTALVYGGIVLTLVTRSHDPAPLLLAVAPAPLIAIVSFLIMLGGNVLQRAEYLVELELELQGKMTPCSRALPVPDGFRRSEWIFDQAPQKTNGESHRTAGGALWPQIGLTVVVAQGGFIVFAIRELILRGHCVLAGVAGAAYLALVLLQALGLSRLGLRPPANAPKQPAPG